MKRIRSAPFKARLPKANNEKCFKCNAVIYPIIVQNKVMRSCPNCKLIQVKCPSGEILKPNFEGYDKGIRFETRFKMANELE